MFDDLHWGDESSAAALHYVARTNREQPLFGILASRTDELNDNAPMQRALRELRHAGLLHNVEDAAHARMAIQKIGRARMAEQVPADLLEELEDLHEYLLGTLLFG